MKNISKILCVILVANFLVTSGFNLFKADFSIPKAEAHSLNPNYVIDDSRFLDKDSMSVGDIQRFLEEKGSELKDFSENGRSAAQIIYDAAHGHGEASGPPPNGCYNGICINTGTGTVSPKVLLATMQKEQSLITNSYAYGDKDRAYNCAMGYEAGQGCSWMFENKPQWKGFTNQVEWAAWQLRYNFEGSATNAFSNYQVGQTMNFSGQDVHLDNRATAALYRYTPYIQYGFHNIYYSYFGNLVGDMQRYNADPTSQTAFPDHALEPGEVYSVEAKFLNSGSETWRKNEVNLGTKDPLDRISIFSGGAGWFAPGSDKNRVRMNEDEVGTGDTATFNFEFKAPDERPDNTTTYVECLKPVKDAGDDIGWFHDDDQVCWHIEVAGKDKNYHYEYVSQSPSSPDYITMMPGETSTFELAVKNTSEYTWTRDVVRLGTARPTDRIPFYETGSGWRDSGDKNRILMTEESVAPGSEAHFSFEITLPQNTAGGTYREYFRVVADNIGWMEDYGIYYDIKVPTLSERFNADWQSQNRSDSVGADPITLYRGQKYNFTVSFKNTGLQTWYKNTVKLGTSHPTDRTSAFVGYPDEYGWASENRIQMEQDSVAPGEVATFSFDMSVPGDISGGEYREYFQLVADGITWLQDHGVYWRIRIP